jgi:rod shape-determining protein MreB
MSDTQTESAPGKSAAATPPKLKQSAKTILLGFDLGTNKSCLISGSATTDDIELGKILPSIVGYVKSGVVNGIIPGDADVLYGEQAIQNGLHVELTPPLADGVIGNPKAARDFVAHVRSLRNLRSHPPHS